MRRIAALMAVCSLSACAPERAGPVATNNAPTFVSLNPCLDAILIEVAEAEQILALSHYSRDPSSSSIDVERARAFGVTGGTAEEVLALEPDIVLASSFIAPTTRTAFERLGLRVETFGSPATVEESLDQVRRMAELTGLEQAGDELAERIATAPEQPTGADFSALVWQPGQIVPGETTLISEHLRWAGLSSHSSANGLGQADFVSLETLLADPPDILLVAGDRPGQTHPLLDTQRGMMVADFDTSLLFCGGPTIPKARERLSKVRAEFERNFKRAAQ
ncbi:MAG: ABC transporter substrate-binding protein [Pseudomonadota bacterium]